jgi:hypothetical protein
LTGYFFNGRQYVCFDGDKSEWHPLLDDFVEDWVASENAKVTLSMVAVAAAQNVLPTDTIVSVSPSAVQMVDEMTVLSLLAPTPQTPTALTPVPPTTPLSESAASKPRRFLPKPPIPKPSA